MNQDAKNMFKHFDLTQNLDPDESEVKSNLFTLQVIKFKNIKRKKKKQKKIQIEINDHVLWNMISYSVLILKNQLN